MNDTYSAASGEGIYAGMVAPSTETALETFIAAMSPNSWAEYTGTNINAMDTTRFDGGALGIMESEMNYPITNWANKFVWDPTSKRISGVGTAQGFQIAGGERYSKQVIFDLALNQFTLKWNPTGQRQGHIYDGNCSGFVGDLTFRKSYNAAVLWAYNKSTDLWAASHSLEGLSSISTIWSIDCSGTHNALYCLEQLTGRLVKFDLTTGVRSVVGNHTGVGAYPLVVSVGNYVVFGAGDVSTKLYKIDVAGVVTLVSDALPVPYDSRGSYRLLPHPTDSLKALCFSQSDSTIRALDITTGVFSVVGSIPTEPQMSASVSASLVGLSAVATWRGAGRSGGVTQSKFWIYKV